MISASLCFAHDKELKIEILLDVKCYTYLCHIRKNKIFLFINKSMTCMYTCIQDFTHIERFVIINYDLPMEVKQSCEAFMYERGDKIKVKYNEVIQDSFLSSSAIVIVAPHHRNKMSLVADFINI